MAEYIERDKLAFELCKVICGEERSLCVSHPRNCMQRLMQPIYKQPAADVAPVVRWISVKDRLPEDDEKVIAYCKKVNKYFVGFTRKSYYGNTYWCLVGAVGATYCVKPKVTHWMPMPEPPKEE